MSPADACRYLFNAGEGFQRFCVQHQVKLNRLTDLLFTRLTTDASGGLPGKPCSAFLGITERIHAVLLEAYAVSQAACTSCGRRQQPAQQPSWRYIIGSIWKGCCACAGMCLTQSDVLGGYTVGREPFKINVYGPQVRRQHAMLLRVFPLQHCCCLAGPARSMLLQP